MRRFRFRIGSLLILIVFLGVGFAALREATDLWDGIVLNLAIGVLLLSLVLAIHRQAEGRAFWVAFALFGWVYLGLTALPSLEPRLLTTRLLTYLDSLIPGRPAQPGAFNWLSSPYSSTYNAPQFPPTIAFSPQGKRVASNNSAVFLLWSAAAWKPLWTGAGTTENFMWIGHSLFALILAWLGGSLSRRLDLRSRRTDPLPPSVEASGVA